MRKFTTIVFAILLVLVVGQATFASANIGANVGYVMGLGKTDVKGISFGVDGSYYFTDNFGIGAEASGIIVFGNNKSLDNVFNIELVAKYDVFKFDAATIGVQAGLIDSISPNAQNIFAIAAGAYVNANLAENFNFSLDAKFPIFTTHNGTGNTQAGFFKLFLYDVELGVTYDITSDINVGGQLEVTNINYTIFDTVSIPTLSIGIKAGYTF